MTNEMTVKTSRPLAPLFHPGPLDQTPAAVYLAGLGEGSRRTMRQALDTIAGIVSSSQADALTLPWASLRFQHTAAIRAALAEKYKPATANKMLSALRGTLKAARRLGQIGAEDYVWAIDLDPIKGETLPAGRALSSGEISALMDVCAADQSPIGARDAALSGILYCGLRRAEVVALDLADYDAQAGTLYPLKAGTLRVKGKRSKERLVPVVNGAALAVADWLVIRGDEPGPLFLPLQKGGKVRRRRLNNQAVYDLLQVRARQAGVKDLSPHDFRRTVAGDLLDAGTDVITVQKILGHASPETTGRYDRRPEAAKAKAMSRLHLPYRRRTLIAGSGA